MLDLLLHIFMMLGAVIAIGTVLTIWFMMLYMVVTDFYDSVREKRSNRTGQAVARYLEEEDARESN